MKTLDIDRIADLLREVSAEVVLPRFRAMTEREIELKPSTLDPDDIVTVADREVEEWMTGALRGLDPSVPVVGEEGVYADPTLLRILDSSEPFWILDPIDGTKNFARGEDAFGIMLARVERGETQGAWIFLPIRGEMYSAESGSGAFRDGEQIRSRTHSSGEMLRGSLHLRYMPAKMATSVATTLEERVTIADDIGCSAVEYTRILMGEREFAIYHRLHPWDHAPGALLVTEGGGRVEHLDGKPYGPRSLDQITVVANDPAAAGELRGWLRTGS